jgi:hypothetical protein
VQGFSHSSATKDLSRVGHCVTSAREPPTNFPALGKIPRLPADAAVIPDQFLNQATGLAVCFEWPFTCTEDEQREIDRADAVGEGGFALAALTGVTFFVGAPEQYIDNPAFYSSFSS